MFYASIEDIWVVERSISCLEHLSQDQLLVKKHIQSCNCTERRMATFIQSTRWSTNGSITWLYNISVH